MASNVYCLGVKSGKSQKKADSLVARQHVLQPSTCNIQARNPMLTDIDSYILRHYLQIAYSHHSNLVQTAECWRTVETSTTSTMHRLHLAGSINSRS